MKLGVCGSGKSHLCSDIIITHLKNNASAKIVILAGNNLAIDSLAEKVLEKIPEVRLARPVSQKWVEHLPIRMAAEGVKFEKVEEAVAVLGSSIELVAMTADTALGVPNEAGPEADLILFDEAAMSFEAHNCYAIAPFFGPKTTTIFCGDIYQLKMLALSPHAKLLRIDVSPMQRLLELQPIYAMERNLNSKYPIAIYLTTCYRLPPEVTDLIGRFYPFKIYSKPDPKKNARYINLPNMPRGNIIFHPAKAK